MRQFVCLRALWTCTCVVLACTAVGCGSSNIAPVSGTINLDGAPLADVTVSFVPGAVDGTAPISTGRTNTAGNYSLTMVIENTRGAILGRHMVRVSRNIESKSDVMSAEELKQSYLPPHDFTFEVKPGNNQADFDLVSPKGKK